MVCNCGPTSVHPEVDPLCVSLRITQCKMNANENKDFNINSNLITSL